jgi:RHS repeat-associated protein
VRQKFTSKERDIETGLDYFGARYYASTQGRFTSADPLNASMRVIDPQTMNRFVFCLNNPLRYVDPDGLKEKTPWQMLTRDERAEITPKLVNENAHVKMTP